MTRHADSGATASLGGDRNKPLQMRGNLCACPLARPAPVGWSTTNEVLSAERGRHFAWLTNPDIEGGATRWEYRFEPVEGGTLVIESFALTDAQVARGRTLSGRVWGALGRLIGESERKTIAGMESTLHRLKAVAEDQ